VGDIEYNPDKKLEVFNATLRNMITLGFLTGKEPSRLEDHEALIHQREEMLRQKFESVQVVYLARGRELGQALARQDTGGYVFVSHGATDEPSVMGDDQQLITRSEVKAMMQTGRDRYITRVLPPAIAKLYDTSRSADAAAAAAAKRALAGIEREDKALYKYVVSESAKVHLELSHVEHYSCYSAMRVRRLRRHAARRQRRVPRLRRPDRFHRQGRPRDVRGRTVAATRFRAKTGRPTPDPDPVGTMRKKKPGAEDAACWRRCSGRRRRCSPLWLPRREVHGGSLHEEDR